MSTLTQATQYITFKLGDELFAINVSQVREVLDLSLITKVPTAPAYMRGVVNVRGNSIPVVDLRLKFGLPKTADTVNTRTLVLELELGGEITVLGGIADSVHEVIELDASQINPPPTIAMRWDEALKRVVRGASLTGGRQLSGNAGMIFTKCRSADDMAILCKKIDDRFRNSDYPTRTQTEEAFGKMFEEMFGDLRRMIFWIGLAVVLSLLFVAGNSMAMSMRERTAEVAVLKAIGFNRGLLLFLVMTESVLVAGAGGILGSLGCKGLCELVDLSQYTAGFLPFFYVPWNVALQGLAVSLLVGFAGGIYPALRAANLRVVDGLRRVI